MAYYQLPKNIIIFNQNQNWSHISFSFFFVFFFLFYFGLGFCYCCCCFALFHSAPRAFHVLTSTSWSTTILNHIPRLTQIISFWSYTLSAMIKHSNQRNSEWGRTYLSYSSRSQTLEGCQSRYSIRSINSPSGSCLAFLYHQVPHAEGMGLPTVEWALLHQVIIQAIPHRPIWFRKSFNWYPLLRWL